MRRMVPEWGGARKRGRMVDIACDGNHTRAQFMAHGGGTMVDIIPAEPI